MNDSSAADEPRHPIQVAARRSGLTPDVIRVWERRYRAVTPGRSDTNRRLYSDRDVERLFLLGRATRGGHRIGEVAEMPIEDLRTLVTDDREAVERVGFVLPPGRRLPAQGHLDRCIEAVRNLDAVGLEESLADASVDLTAPALADQLLGPLMQTIGDQWKAGRLRIAHEHLATATVRTFLGALRRSGGVPASAPELIVAAPAGQRHELGALLVSVAAVADGWNALFMGADLPAAEIAAAQRARGARAVALSIVYPADDPGLVDELRELREGLGGRVPLFIGGSAAGAYRSVIERIDARLVQDLTLLRSELETLRLEGPPAVS